MKPFSASISSGALDTKLSKNNIVTGESSPWQFSQPAAQRSLSNYDINNQPYVYIYIYMHTLWHGASASLSPSARYIIRK